MKEEWLSFDRPDPEMVKTLMAGVPFGTSLEEDIAAARKQSAAEAEVRERLEELRAEAKSKRALVPDGAETEMALVLERKRHEAEMNGVLDSLDRAEQERLDAVAEVERTKPQIMRTIGEMERVAEGVPVYGRWDNNKCTFVAVRSGVYWSVIKAASASSASNLVLRVEEVWSLATHGITWVLPVPLVEVSVSGAPVLNSDPDWDSVMGPASIKSLKEMAGKFLGGVRGASGVNITFDDRTLSGGTLSGRITAPPIAPKMLDHF